MKISQLVQHIFRRHLPGKTLLFSRARLKEIKSHIPSEAESGVLCREINTLRKNLKSVLQHPGEYVLIFEDGIVGYYKSYSDAINKGYGRFGLKQFMVHEVDELTRPPMRLPMGCIPITLVEAAVSR